MANEINTGSTITARLICDSNITVSAFVIERKNDWVILKKDGKIIRKKVKKSYDGTEYVLADGSYSMAPQYKA